MEEAISKRSLRALALAASAASVLAALGSIPAAAADWPMFRGNAARTGFADEAAAPPLARDWEFTAGGEIMSSPAVYAGVVYFGARDGRIRALSAASGALLWEYAAGGWVESSPAAADGRIYAASLDGFLYSLDAATGRLAWRAPLGGASVSSPLVSRGRVYIGVGRPANALKILDAASGAELALVPAGQPVESAPSTDGVAVYYGANDGALYSVSAQTGQKLWSYETRGGRYAMGAAPVAGGIIYALPGYDETRPLALDADKNLLNPQSQPFVALDAWVQAGAPAVAGGALFFPGGSVSNSLYAYSAAPSAQSLDYIWSSTPVLGSYSPRGLLSSPAVAGGVIYVGSIDGYLAAYSTATGASLPLTADASLPGPAYASPAVANGRVFIAGGRKVVAFRAANTAAISFPAEGAVVSGTVAVRGYAGQPGLSGYMLEYGTGTAPSSWILISSPASGQLADAPLGDWDTSDLPNGLYTLKLSLLPASANEARLTLRLNRPPAPPSGLTAADAPGDGGNRLDLSWNASSGAPEGYRIYRDSGDGPSLLVSVGSATLSYADLAAVTGTTYYYTVRSFDAYSESEDSNMAAAFSVNDTGDFTAPAATSDLAAAPGAGAGSLLLEWTAAGDDGFVGTASQYRLLCSTDSAYNWAPFDAAWTAALPLAGTWRGAALRASSAAVQEAGGEGAQVELDGLLGGRAYYCALKTADSVPNLSPLSNIAAGTATADTVPPAPPLSLSAADKPADDGGSVQLAWQLSPDDGAGARDVYGYKVFRRVLGGAYVSSAPLAVLDPGTGFYEDNSAAEGVRFNYAVAAFDSTSDSALSAEASAISASNWRLVDIEQGGSLRLADGARVEIPAGAVPANDGMMIYRLDPATYQPLQAVKADTQARPTSVIYEIKLRSSTARLARPALITLPYTDDEVAGMQQENLRIYRRPAAGGPWRLLNTSAVDRAAKKVTAETAEFSYFSIMEYVPSGAVLAESEVYTYPNPARGGTVTFKFRPAYKADVKIDVYNVAGEKVARLEKADCPAATVSELVWRAGGVASGVYVYRLQARTAAGSKTVEKKLAIIH